jgi:penicillin-binding protein 1B
MAEQKPNPKKAKFSAMSSDFFKSTFFKISVSLVLLILISASGGVLYYYNYYSRIIDRKLGGEIFKNTAEIYAAPYRIYPGQKLSADDVVARLQRAGFDTAEKGGSDDGAYEIDGTKVTIRPKVGDAMRLEFQKNSLRRILKVSGDESSEAWLPAELVTNLFDETRQKRRIVEFNELPKNLVDALIASEDQHFYSHWGIDPVRLVGAMVASLRDSDRVRGTSTITQQLARTFFLSPDRSIKRKLNEIFISLLLEQRLTKQQILTLYANEVYLGQRGSFSIHGFGEGAAAYFGKDLTGLTLPEAATLVAIIPAPNGVFSVVKHPDDVKRRRNQILNTMHTLGTVSNQEFEKAKTSELEVAPIKIDATDAPYMVDFIREELRKDFSEDALNENSLRVYTTLDPALQKAAVEAVQKGLKSVEDELAALNRRKKNPDNLPGPQAGLIALDPHTGEIKAMVGGSDYAASQYNRITQAFRQPGSIFKPFVYAAAFETAFDRTTPADGVPESSPPEAAPIDGGPTIDSFRHEGLVTPLTTFVDEPTTFVYEGDRIYEPNNFKQEYRGVVTLRTALQHSLNVPTIKLAERIGYDRVAKFARRMGLNAKIKGYPSVALGAFEVTPIEMAGAYTAFANEGLRMQPHALVRVSTVGGATNKIYKYDAQEVMRPELAYLMTNLMEGVLESGTGVRVRALGFNLPAAGKTGTSRDGWFAGYTKDLLAIAWVGYDDNRDLNLEGAHSALPIWTEFMLKATQLYPPADPDKSNFEPPPGIEFARIDAESLVLANPSCPETFEEAFIAGTVPTSHCPLHGFSISETVEHGVTDAGKGVGKVVTGIGKFFGRIFGGGDKDIEQEKGEH